MSDKQNEVPSPKDGAQPKADLPSDGAVGPPSPSPNGVDNPHGVVIDKTRDIVAQEVVPDRTATIAETFSQATSYDYMLMFFGSLGGLVTGFSLPFFNILFGRILDNLNGSASSFSKNINFLCIVFCIVAAANLLSGWMQEALWTRAGARMTQKFRENYVRAILAQEIGWFDTVGANELSTKVAELTGKVEGVNAITFSLSKLFCNNVPMCYVDGIGRKLGELWQFAAQIVFGYAIAFYFNWKLTLVLFASFPLIAGSGAYMINAVTSATVL
jgi:ATP-binding cassette subfamily B (MDR/TAP) protein 1